MSTKNLLSFSRIFQQKKILKLLLYTLTGGIGPLRIKIFKIPCYKLLIKRVNLLNQFWRCYHLSESFSCHKPSLLHLFLFDFLNALFCKNITNISNNYFILIFAINKHGANNITNSITNRSFSIFSIIYKTNRLF